MIIQMHDVSDEILSILKGIDPSMKVYDTAIDAFIENEIEYRLNEASKDNKEYKKENHNKYKTKANERLDNSEMYIDSPFINMVVNGAIESVNKNK